MRWKKLFPLKLFFTRIRSLRRRVEEGEGGWEGGRDRERERYE